MDIPTACERAMQLLQGDALRSGTKLDVAKFEEWSQGLNRIRLETSDSRAWEQATRLLARLSLASEFPADDEIPALAGEIEAFLRGPFEGEGRTAVPPRSELSDISARAELLLSTARDLLPQYRGSGAGDAAADYGRLSSNVGRLVEEISASIDRATAQAKDEMKRLSGRGEG
jgi:hypothetical protein